MTTGHQAHCMHSAACLSCPSSVQQSCWLLCLYSASLSRNCCYWPRLQLVVFCPVCHSETFHSCNKPYTASRRALTSHQQRWLTDWAPTQCRLYGRRFLQVKRPNQQYQSTKGNATKDKSNNENNKIHICIDNNKHKKDIHCVQKKNTHSHFLFIAMNYLWI